MGRAGNSMVLFAIIRSPRLRSMTNFLLGNLAIADFSVGVFCVLPNLSTFLHPTWVLGKAMCKIYYYIWNVSYIGSITILTVIAVERYIAILHPLKARTFMTNKRLILVQILVWLIAIFYNIPYLIFYDTISFSDLGKEFCYSDYEHFESLKWLSLANLIVWYVMPLLLIGFMYYKVGRALWKTTVVSALRLQPYPDISTSMNSHISSGHYNNDTTHRYCQHTTMSGSASGDHQPTSSSEESQSRGSDRASFKIKGNNNLTLVCGIHRGDDMQELKCFIPRTMSSNSHTTGSDVTIRLYETNELDSYCRQSNAFLQGGRYRQTYLSSSRRVAKARKKVIRLLLSVVITFGICVLPHMMKVLNHYWMIFDLPHAADTILSPISFIILYLNSVLNPFLYAMFSKNFRRSFKEALPCIRRKKAIVREV
ncbi:hypothetical protein ACF0H5_004196 [Mactra antiquata]